MHMQSFRVVVAAAAVCAVAAPGLAGELNPPGAPGPTMKPLDVVEARTPIFAADFPLTINQPGSYYLAENIVTAGGGITIDASDVTIDLNGFALTGGSGAGIQDSGVVSNITVHNGTVRDWPSGGVVLNGTEGGLVFDVRTSGNGSQGVWVFAGIVRNCVSTNDVITAGVGSYSIAVTEGLIEGCASIDSNGSGIWIGVNGTIRGSAVRNCSGNGYRLGSGSTLADSMASSTGADGVNASSGVTINGVTIDSALGDGVDASTGATITNSTFRFCAQNGVFARGGANITNNNATSCGAGAVDGAGFRTENGGNRIDSNNAANCNRGYYITEPGDFMIRNTARNCTVGYQQTGTNVYGTIISGNFSPISTTNPWVNFEIF